MKNRKRNQPPEDIILPTEDIEREYFPDYFKEKMEKADRKKSIDYILDSKPAAPLPQGMRNSVGFCFIGGLATLLRELLGMLRNPML